MPETNTAFHLLMKRLEICQEAELIRFFYGVGVILVLVTVATGVM